MLLTLKTSSIRSLVIPRRGAKPKVALADLPKYVLEQLGLSGMCLTTDLLAGATRETIEALRDRGDKAGCVCLTLVEPDTLPLGDFNTEKAQGGIDRATRVLKAASLLGCSAAGIAVGGRNDDAHFARAIERMKVLGERAERLDMNLLLMPTKGPTAEPDRLVELIKKVGGFRIGALPDFEAAAASGDGVGYLRRLTPYATVVNASTFAFIDPPEPDPEPEAAAEGTDKTEEAELAIDFEDDSPLTLEDLAAVFGQDGEGGEVPAFVPPMHEPYDLGPLVEAIVGVGFDGSLAIDYRGSESGTLGVCQSQDALEAALAAAPGK